MLEEEKLQLNKIKSEWLDKFYSQWSEYLMESIPSKNPKLIFGLEMEKLFENRVNFER